jgi:hypothetical protein
MELTSLSVGIDVLISIVFGAGGALGVWFKLKGSVNIMATEIQQLQKELESEETDRKEQNKQIHKRVDALKITVEKNRERSDNSTNQLVGEMNKMELRIIQAIHEIGKK